MSGTNTAPVAPDSGGFFGPILRDLGDGAREGLKIVVQKELSELASERNVPDRGDRGSPASAKEAKPDSPEARAATGGANVPTWVWWVAGGFGLLLTGGVIIAIAKD
ncbi:MAG: hypothetical protein KY410_10995 [Proteobacteria bacterium]|nr:hypothetical protein [Pseudomonadota bacterium]